MPGGVDTRVITLVDQLAKAVAGGQSVSSAVQALREDDRQLLDGNVERLKQIHELNGLDYRGPEPGDLAISLREKLDGRDGLGVSTVYQRQAKERRDEAISRLANDLRRFSLGKPTAVEIKQTRVWPPPPGAPPYGTVTYARGDFEYGALGITGIDAGITGGTEYRADVYVAAIKCYGTDDPGGIFKEPRDEPYVIATSLSLPDVLEGGPITQVWQSPVYNGIEKGRIFAENTLMFSDLKVGRHGLTFKIALLDQEHGNPSDVRAKVEEVAQKIAKDAKSAVSALANIDIDKAIDQGGYESGVLSLLGDVGETLLVDLFKDNLIAEKTWQIPAEIIKKWVDDPGALAGSQVHYDNNDIPSHFKSNFPYENHMDKTYLFENGDGATYRILLRVQPYKVVRIAPAPID